MTARALLSQNGCCGRDLAIPMWASKVGGGEKGVGMWVGVNYQLGGWGTGEGEGGCNYWDVGKSWRL